MKRNIALLALVGLLVYWSVPGTAQIKNADVDSALGVVSVDALMQQKLRSSQALLKGLALDDYELIKREAQRLQLLSLDAGWHTIQTKDYARISGEFREAARQIYKAGEKKNLDSAGLGYFKLTMTCIDCHRHVRNIQAGDK